MPVKLSVFVFPKNLHSYYTVISEHLFSALEELLYTGLSNLIFTNIVKFSIYCKNNQTLLFGHIISQLLHHLNPPPLPALQNSQGFLLLFYAVYMMLAVSHM